jgi:hypothetical protein
MAGAMSSDALRRLFHAKAGGGLGVLDGIKQTHGQRKLEIVIPAFVLVHKVLQEKRNVTKL